MQRIFIIGNGGTGKSTLGEKLGKILCKKVYHLDKLTFKPGWIRTEEEEFKKTLDKIISGESWIIEGWSYHSTLKKRLEAADVIIYLKFPVHICYLYALKRHISYSFRQNPYDPEDSPILFKTKKMIKAMWKVYKEYEPELNVMLNKMEKKNIIVFNKRVEVNEFIKQTAEYGKMPSEIFHARSTFLQFIC